MMNMIVLGKEAEKILRLPTARSEYVKNSEHLIRISKKSGFPIVLKIISGKAVHKTEVNAVRIVQDSAELRKHYIDLGMRAKKMNGKLLAQEFVRGREFVVGIKKDPVFGHAIMFGIGGTLVEALHDVSFRICPISSHDANSMINELKYKSLLYGFRGEKPVNVKAIKSILVKVSKLKALKKISELDINPLIANEKTAKVVDVRISVISV